MTPILFTWADCDFGVTLASSYGFVNSWNQGVSIAAKLDKQPAGVRAVLINGNLPLFSTPGDTLAMVEGIRLTRIAVAGWIRELADNGVTHLTHAFFDVEDQRSRWAADMTPAKFAELLKASGVKQTGDADRDDVTLIELQNRTLNDVVFTALRAAYPGIVCSVYGDNPIAPADVTRARDKNGHMYAVGPSGADAYAPCLDGQAAGVVYLDKTIATPIGRLAWALNHAHAALRFGPVIPWLSLAHYAPDLALDYADELNLLALVLGRGEAVWWNPPGETKADETDRMRRVWARLMAILNGRTIECPIRQAMQRGDQPWLYAAAYLNTGELLVVGVGEPNAKPLTVHPDPARPHLSVRLSQDDGRGCFRLL